MPGSVRSMKPPTKRKIDIKDSLEWLLARSPWARPADAGSAQEEETKAHIPNLRHGLEWLLGQSGDINEVSSSESELARHERRIELLVWLLNLEKRLPPYGDEQPA